MPFAPPHHPNASDLSAPSPPPRTSFSIKDYPYRVFGMIQTLKYLDKMDADENERPETDDEEEEEDLGSGEVDGGDWSGRSVNGVGGSSRGDAVVDVDEDEDKESEADEEETETGRRVEANGFVRGSHHHLTDGFRVAPAGAASIDVEDEEEEEDVEDDDEEEEGIWWRRLMRMKGKMMMWLRCMMSGIVMRMLMECRRR